MNQREMRKQILAGNAAGRAWADSNRAVNTVAAVARWQAALDDRDGDRGHKALFKIMVKEIGDDDEFAALKTKHFIYRDAWYGGVIEVFEEWQR
jgi:hypothetical protein